MWRTGRKVGRTIYRQLGPEPSDGDPLIGVMDRIEDADLVVQAVNAEGYPTLWAYEQACEALEQWKQVARNAYAEDPGLHAWDGLPTGIQQQLDLDRQWS